MIEKTGVFYGNNYYDRDFYEAERKKEKHNSVNDIEVYG